MRLDAIPGSFAVCLLDEVPDVATLSALPAPIFLTVAANEICLVCPSDAIPPDAAAVEDGWGMLRVVGPLDFSLVGIVAQLSDVLARVGIPIFVASTYLTDYLLVKANRLPEAIDALKGGGHTVTDSPQPARP